MTVCLYNIIILGLRFLPECPQSSKEQHIDDADDYKAAAQGEQNFRQCFHIPSPYDIPAPMT